MFFKIKSNRTELEACFSKQSQTEPNSKHVFQNKVKRNRSRSMFLKIKSNRTDKIRTLLDNESYDLNDNKKP